MKKKILIMFLIPVCLLMTGCGGVGNSDYKSQESVAKKMAECMSKGDYKCSSKLLYPEENLYVDESAFLDYINAEKINIKGNKKIEVVKKEINKDATQDNVEIRIDNNKILSINVKKLEKKWYVDLGSYNYDDFTLNVPKGSTLKINGKKIDSKLKKEKELEEYKYRLDLKVTYDSYKFKVLEGKYRIELEKSGLETLNETIDTENYYSEKNSSFDHSSDGFTARMKLSASNIEEINKSINSMYTKYFDSANKKEEFSKALEAFGDKTSEFEGDKSNYDNMVKKQEVINSYSIERKEKLRVSKIENQEDCDFVYLDDEHILGAVKVTLKYHHYFEYNGFMQSMDASSHKDEDKETSFNTSLVISKSDKEYKIVDGYNTIPYLYF